MREALEALEGRGWTARRIRRVLSGVERRLSAVEGSMPRTAFGSYTGNGTSGPESPVSLTFSFPPQLLAVRRPAPPPTAPACSSSGGVTQGGGLGHIDFYVNVTWSGNQVSWYTSKDNPHPDEF